MSSVQVMLVCLLSVCCGVNGDFVCEGANFTLTCNPGEIVQFGDATFTRKNNQISHIKNSIFAACEKCCLYGDTSNTDPVTKESNPDAYNGDGVYKECGNADDFSSNLNSHCKNTMTNTNNVCNIEVSLSFWNLLTGTTTNDPCPGTYKYLDFDYACVNP